MYIKSSKGGKIGRRWLWVDYDGSIVCTGKEYGTFSKEASKSVRLQVQGIIDDRLRRPRGDWKVTYDGDDTSIYAVYCDSGYGVSWHKPTLGEEDYPNDFGTIYDECPEGLDVYDEVSEGYWESDRSYCYECEERYSEDNMTYVDSIDSYVCDRCLSEDYTWCVGYGEYFRDNDYEFYKINGFTYSQGYLDNYSSNVDAIWCDYEDTWLHCDDVVYLVDIGEYMRDTATDMYKYSESREDYVSIGYEEEEEED
jgi:hypothetical protein